VSVVLELKESWITITFTTAVTKLAEILLLLITVLILVVVVVVVVVVVGGSSSSIYTFPYT
jgi:hypothetical protein